MSKITPKNLHYDSTLPPFLARLQANNNTRDGRNEFTVARPKRARTAEDEAEDEPVYFNEESGETLTKSEWEAREAGEADANGDGSTPATTSAATAGAGDAGEKRSEGGSKIDGKEEKFASIGAAKKKRKVGKVVVGESEDEREDEERNEERNGEVEREREGEKEQGKKVDDDKSKPATTTTTTTKKAKKKKIKLSFDD